MSYEQMEAYSKQRAEEEAEKKRKHDAYMDSLDVNNIDTIPSAKELFDVIQALLEEDNNKDGYYKQEALRIILSELSSYFGREDYELCNDFLKLMYDKLDDTDVMFHILHALSWTKDELSFWEEFKTKCREVFIEKRGEDVANRLMKSIEKDSPRNERIKEKKKRRKYGI